MYNILLLKVLKRHAHQIFVRQENRERKLRSKYRYVTLSLLDLWEVTQVFGLPSYNLHLTK